MDKAYDIETDWVINTACNFNCIYCISHSNIENPAVGKVLPKEIVKFFNNTGLRWLIHITGGEPFLYPNFIELCQRLTEKHFININTNLSQKNVLDFARLIKPGKVTFINCGLHIIQREKKNLVGDFIEKFHLLRTAGFNLFVSCVMYPPLFKRFEKDFEYFKSREIIISPKALRGVFFGRRYPQLYSPEEKKMFVNYSKRSGKTNTSSQERPIIDLSLDRRFLDGIPNFKGKFCLAGKRFVRIWPDGTITRCGKKNTLGNLFKFKLNLLTKPQKCDDYSCPYFCFKYSTLTFKEKYG